MRKPLCPDCPVIDGEPDWRFHLDAPTLKVSTQRAVGVLAKIQEILEGAFLVEGPYGFLDYLDALHEACRSYPREGGRVLELIDHASAGDVLTLGGQGGLGVSMTAAWLAREHDGRILSALQKLITASCLREVRLIGCRTGCGDAQAHLVALSELLRVPVLGTTRMIDEEDFEAGGLRPPLAGVLTSSAAARCACAS